MDKYGFGGAKYGTHSIILNNIGENKTVLDIGCNKGYIGNNSSKTNIFYGLEYDENSLVHAKSIYKDAIQYDLNSLKELPWNIKFDVINFGDVLEHILFPEKVLVFFKKYLNPDGIIIVSLPNIANWQMRLNLFLGNFNYTETGIMDKTHLHFYTFKTAKELVDKTGLNIVKTYGGASVFGYIIKIFPFLRPLLSTNIIFICNKN